METTSLDFEFYLADRLHKTVAEIRAMDNWEFVGWSVYIGREAQMKQVGRGRSD